jgi:hypothetical protein
VSYPAGIDGSPAGIGSVRAAVAADPYQWTLPQGALAQTCPPFGFFGASPISGTLQLAAVNLPKGLWVSQITVTSAATAASGQTHWWYSLHDRGLMMLAQTADELTGAFPAFTAKGLPIDLTAAGVTTSFTTTYSGLHYIGFQMTATTPCDLNFTGGSSNVPVAGITPLGGRSTTGLTTPPGIGSAAAPLTTSQSFYGYVS